MINEFDLFVSWTGLVVLLFLLIFILRNKRKLDYVCFLVLSCLVILVSGQAVWFINYFYDENLYSTTQLLHYISFEGLVAANITVAVANLIFVSAYIALPNHLFLLKRLKIHAKPNPTLFSSRFYLLVFLIFFVGAFLLLLSAGGAYQFVLKPGLNFNYGVSMLLIFVSIGKYPILLKLYRGCSANKLDTILFLGVLFLNLFSARMNFTFLLIQYTVFYHYFRRDIPKNLFYLIPFLFLFVFIVFGTYREYMSQNLYNDINLDELLYFMYESLNISYLAKWFYTMNVEAFTGLAGILSFYYSNENFAHDFGFSNLRFIFNFIPGAIRNDSDIPIMQIEEYIDSFYPYPGMSVIRSGLEIAFANANYFGIAVLYILILYLVKLFHLVLEHRYKYALIFAILVPQILNLIRGPFTNAIYFGLADLIMLALFLNLEKQFYKRNP